MRHMRIYMNKHHPLHGEVASEVDDNIHIYKNFVTQHDGKVNIKELAEHLDEIGVDRKMGMLSLRAAIDKGVLSFSGTRDITVRESQQT